MNRFVTRVCVCLCLAAAPAAFPADDAALAGLPFTIGQFDSSSPRYAQPHLFITTEEIAQANHRAAHEPATRTIRDRFLEQAGRHLDTEIKPIDEGWWQAAKDKPWEQTYPEVFLNTMLIPNEQARPAAELALAWLLTEKEEYAGKATAFLMNLADYSFEPVHYDVGMNYTIWCINVLRARDLLSSHLSAEQKARLDRFMERAARAVAGNDIYWMDNNIGGGINNHLAWHKLMFGLIGLYYERPEMVEFCMHGRRGLVPLLTDGLLDDGLWLESSLTYQFAAIAPMMILADCQQRMGRNGGSNGVPAIHEITAANGRTLKQSYDAMFNVLAPDGMIPPIGDAYGARAKLYKNPLYEYCWKLWRDPKYAWLIAQNPEPTSYMLFAPPLPAEETDAATQRRGDAAEQAERGTIGEASVLEVGPEIGTLLLPEHGYAFLRSHRNESYWNNAQARCALLTYDRSSVHANADKLSLMLFGLNRMLISDVEGKATVPHAFSSKIQRELNRGGLSQNTVMIDGLDQRCAGEMLDLIEFRDLPDEKRVTAADRRGILYDGVRQMRSIAMTEDYVLDVFQVDVGEKPRQIDWIVHVMDENAVVPPELNPLLAGAEPFTLPATGACPWLRDAQSIALSASRDAVHAMEFRDGPDRLGLRLLGDKGLERLIVCGYPVSDEPDSPNVPMLIARAQASRAVFVAVWLVGKHAPDVRVSPLPDHEGRFVFRIIANDLVREHQIPKL